MDMTGQAVVVTGSSSGIGEEVARRLDALGAGIVVNSAKSAEAGEKIAGELRDAVYVQGDIGDPTTAEALVRAATDRWGRLDGLVNNAAVTVTVPLADLDNVRVEHWEKVLRTNVIGTFLVSQACLPLLRAAPEGWIVNVTSLAGTRQSGSSLPYAVSKAAVNHMTTLLAKFVGSNVRVNGVAPGLVATPWTATWDDRKQAVEANAPLHRVATPEDIADAVLAVISCRYATGSTLLVDGGLGLVI
ncbi:MAG TPA: SDR family oxidoreductase [Acidimicrobiales bacterium]|nr:SDR family oxidoreductase [Acidimicrobiales bacterium]